MAWKHRRSVILPALLLIPGCIDTSKAVAVCPAGPDAPKACGTAMRASDDGLIDDFEDGDTQVAKMADRTGHWFASKDPSGSTIEPSPLTTSQPGAGSEKALHISGQTSSSSDAWGALVGVNFIDGGVYDASKYSGIAFKAKVGATSTKGIRFNVGDINTHPDGGVCKTCWNHFGKDLELTGEWREYTISFAEMKQAAGWGDQFATITPSKLFSVNWQIGPGKAYDLWIDDLHFVECTGS